ncbi:MAG TPA: hypothetical protein DEF06_00800 [Clostridiales bacterium]|nr:hypothetical protein [Clostridiales bacterium]
MIGFSRCISKELQRNIRRYKNTARKPPIFVRRFPARRAFRSLSLRHEMEKDRLAARISCPQIYWNDNDLIRQHAADAFGTGIWCLTNPDYYEKGIGMVFEVKEYVL